MDLVDKYLKEIIKGKSDWIGKVTKAMPFYMKDATVKMGQDKNGMWYGEIKQKDGEISSTTANSRKEVDDWLSGHGIRDIKWNK